MFYGTFPPKLLLRIWLLPRGPAGGPSPRCFRMSPWGRMMVAALCALAVTCSSAWTQPPVPLVPALLRPPPGARLCPRIPPLRGTTGPPRTFLVGLRSSHDCNHHFDEDGEVPEGVSSDLWEEGEGDGGEEELPPLEYVGPISERGIMEAGVEIGDIGLEVLVGPSRVGDGRGLFVALSDGVERTILPKGTPICGYAREGVWEKEATGDKCVGYAFHSVDTAVFFEKRLMPLIECAALVEEGDIGTCIRGHKVFFDNEDETVQIEADGEDRERYYVPVPPEGAISVGNMGMFSNDIAFQEGCSEAEYLRESEGKDILELAWRMELEQEGEFAGQRVRPTWPVVILSRDVAFNNGPNEPMEVGVHYGWKYWHEEMAKNRKKGET